MDKIINSPSVPEEVKIQARNILADIELNPGWLENWVVILLLDKHNLQWALKEAIQGGSIKAPKA